MAHKLERLLIVDIECTCWESREDRGHMPMEVIEVGVVDLHLPSLKIEDARGILVRPEFSTVSDFCTQLTGHTQESLDANGIPFRDAMAKLRRDFRSEKVAWASWGDFDRRHIRGECNHKQVTYPYGRTHFNLKALFSMLGQHRRQYGMVEALEMTGLELKGRHHSGVDDAVNIARIFISQQHGLRAGRALLCSR